MTITPMLHKKMTKNMKAIVQKGYGAADVFELRDVPMPEPEDDEVRVKVHAAGLHAGDVFTM